MDLTFLLSLIGAMFVAIAGLVFYQTVWKQRRRRELERRHHANKRRPIG